MILSLLVSFFFATALAADERVEGLLRLGDHREAIRVAKKEGDKRALVKAYARAGEAEPLLELVSELSDLDDALIEEVAWGLLKSGSRSGALPVQFYATIGAYFSQDIRGVQLLVDALGSSNASIRGSALSVASRMRDPLLQTKVLSLLQKDPSWHVRAAALSAAGSMKIKAAAPLLQQRLEGGSESIEERLAALQGYLALVERPSVEEVERLACSDRAMLRLLACRLVDHFDLSEALPKLAELTEDSNAQVRKAAWLSIGWLDPSQGVMREEAHLEVALMQAWVQARAGNAEALQLQLAHPREEQRQAAAAALCHLGASGAVYLPQLLNSSDPAIRLNGALALIREQLALPQAQKELNHALQEGRAWQSDERNGFSFIRLSKSAALDSASRTEDQQIRLHLLNQLAILNDPTVQEQARLLLRSKQWGVSSSAISLILKQGGEAALASLLPLLEDEERTVRLQAALTLAFWGGEPAALSTLLSFYPEASRREKERILEALGHIGDKEQIPFLVEQLQEPFPQLRMIAASSILLSLRS